MLFHCLPRIFLQLLPSAVAVRWLLLCGLLLVTACSPPRGVYHQVQTGQTLYQISRTYDIPADRIARVNRIADPTQLKVGTRLFIPDVQAVKDVPATVPAHSAPVAAVPKTVPPPPGSKKSAPEASKPAPKETLPPKKQLPEKAIKPANPAKKASSNQVAPKASKGLFQWPAKGAIVRQFGAKGPKGSNGIEIAVGKGSSVMSGAAGKVIYSGNGISGYGNLIILQHDDSYYTVYGFNQKNLVEAGSFVSRGEKIALAGVPPSGGRPRLYFEVRYAKTPVNPILYLP